MKISNYLLIAKRFFVKSYPVQVTHFVTSKCNARCQHCFYWSELNKKKDELTLDEIKKISKSMPSFFFLIISGGEPFLRDDLDEIIKTYYENNNIGNLTIPTNGFLTEKIQSTAKKILESCPNLFFNISLSLDGIGKDHDDLRGVDGLFDRVERTYLKLSELKKDYKNFDVEFLTTISKLNQTKLKLISNYVREKFNGDITVVLLRGNPKEPLAKDIDIKFYDEVSEFQKNRFEGIDSLNKSKLKLMIRKRIYNIRYELLSRTFKEKRYLIPCYACKLDVVINEEGDVYPCEMLNKKIGNLREYGYDFKKLWWSKNAQEIREFIKDSKCFCTHECAMRTNLLYNPKVLIIGTT